MASIHIKKVLKDEQHKVNLNVTSKAFGNNAKSENTIMLTVIYNNYQSL